MSTINDTERALRSDSLLKRAIQQAGQPHMPVPNGLDERVLERLRDATSAPRRRRRLTPLAWVAGTAAAITLLLTLHTGDEKKSVPTFTMPPTPPAERPSPRPMANSDKPTHTDAATASKPAEETLITPLPAPPLKSNARSSMKTTGAVQGTRSKPAAEPILASRDSEEILPDTLGSSILQSPENLLTALNILSQCEAATQETTLDIHNTLMEATFNVMPPSEHAVLVSKENGEYGVEELDEAYIINI